MRSSPWFALVFSGILVLFGAGLFLAGVVGGSPVEPAPVLLATATAGDVPPGALSPHSYTFRHVATAKLPDGIGDNPEAYAAGPGGLLYVANHDSDDVSVVSGTRFLGTVRLTDWTWPADVAVDSTTGYVYVAGELRPALYVLQGLTYTTAISLPSRPSRVAVDSVQEYVYATHADDDVTVIRGTEVITTVHIRDTLTHAEHPVAVNPTTGLAYLVSSWSDGVTTTHSVFVLEGPAVVGEVPLPGYGHALAVDSWQGYVYVADGSGVVDVISGSALLAAVPVPGEAWTAGVEPESGLAYIGHQLPDGIAVLSGTEVISDIVTEPCYPDSFAADPATGYLYALLWCPDVVEEPVLVLRGTTKMAEIRVPRGMDLASDGQSHVYVFSGIWSYVTVLQGTEVAGRIPGRAMPTAVLADPATGYTYVANGHGSNSVSVLSGTQVITSITTCYGPVGLERLAGPDLVYVACEDDLAVSILQRTALLTTTAITTIADPCNAGPLLAAEPQRGWVYFSYRCSSGTVVFSGTELLTTMPNAGSAQAMVVDPGTDCMLAVGGPGLTVFSGTAAITEVVLPGGEWISGLLASPNGYVYAQGQITLYIVRENRLVATLSNFSSDGQVVNPVSDYLHYVTWDRMGIISGTQVLPPTLLPPASRTLYSDTASDRVYALNSGWPLDASFLMFRGSALAGASTNGWTWTRSIGGASGGAYVYLFRGPGPNGNQVRVFEEVALLYQFYMPLVDR